MTGAASRTVSTGHGRTGLTPARLVGAGAFSGALLAAVFLASASPSTTGPAGDRTLWPLATIEAPRPDLAVTFDQLQSLYSGMGLRVRHYNEKTADGTVWLATLPDRLLMSIQIRSVADRICEIALVSALSLNDPGSPPQTGEAMLNTLKLVFPDWTGAEDWLRSAVAKNGDAVTRDGKTARFRSLNGHIPSLLITGLATSAESPRPLATTQLQIKTAEKTATAPSRPESKAPPAQTSFPDKASPDREETPPAGSGPSEARSGEPAATPEPGPSRDSATTTASPPAAGTGTAPADPAPEMTASRPGGVGITPAQIRDVLKKERFQEATRKAWEDTNQAYTGTEYPEFLETGGTDQTLTVVYYTMLDVDGNLDNRARGTEIMGELLALAFPEWEEAPIVPREIVREENSVKKGLAARRDGRLIQIVWNSGEQNGGNLILRLSIHTDDMDADTTR